MAIVLKVNHDHAVFTTISYPHLIKMYEKVILRCGLKSDKKSKFNEEHSNSYHVKN
jgi:hypothetical protein